MTRVRSSLLLFFLLCIILLPLSASTVEYAPLILSVNYVGDLGLGEEVKLIIIDNPNSIPGDSEHAIESIQPNTFKIPEELSALTKIESPDVGVSERFFSSLAGRRPKSADPFEGDYLLKKIKITFKDKVQGETCHGNYCDFYVVLSKSMRDDKHFMNLALRPGYPDKNGGRPFYPSSTIGELLERPDLTVSNAPDKMTMSFEPLFIGNHLNELLFFYGPDGKIVHVTPRGSPRTKIILGNFHKVSGAIQSFTASFFFVRQRVGENKFVSTFIGKKTYSILKVSDGQVNISNGIRSLVFKPQPSESFILDGLKSMNEPVIFKKEGTSYVSDIDLFGINTLRLDKNPCDGGAEALFCSSKDDCFSIKGVKILFDDGFMKLYAGDDKKTLIKAKKVLLSQDSDATTTNLVPWSAQSCRGSSKEDGGKATSVETSARDEPVEARGAVVPKITAHISSDQCGPDCTIHFSVNYPKESYPTEATATCFFGVAKEGVLERGLGNPQAWLARFKKACSEMDDEKLSFSASTQGLSAYILIADEPTATDTATSDLTSVLLPENFQVLATRPLTITTLSHEPQELKKEEIIKAFVSTDETVPVPESSESQGVEESDISSIILDKGVLLSAKDEGEVLLSFEDGSSVNIKDGSGDLSINDLPATSPSKSLTKISLPEKTELEFSSEKPSSVDEDQSGEPSAQSALLHADKATLLIANNQPVVIGALEGKVKDIDFKAKKGLFSTKETEQTEASSFLLTNEGLQFDMKNDDDVLERTVEGGVEKFSGEGSITVASGDEKIKAASVTHVRPIPRSEKVAQITVRNNGRVTAKVARQKQTFSSSTAPRTYVIRKDSILSTTEFPETDERAITIQSFPDGIRLVTSHHSTQHRATSSSHKDSEQEAQHDYWHQQLLNQLGPSWNFNKCPPTRIKRSWFVEAEQAREAFKKFTHNKKPLPLSTIFGVMCVESSLGSSLRSPASALGLMQIVPESAGTDAVNPENGNILSALRRYGQTNLQTIQCTHNCLAASKKYAGSEKFKNLLLYDSQVNIFAGVYYLSWLDGVFNGDTERVLRAYNAGLGNVKQEKTCSIKETNNYINTLCYKIGINCFMGRTMSYCCEKNSYPPSLPHCVA